MKLNYLFILIFSFFSTQTQAQFPNIATDKTFGGSNNDSFNAFVKVGDFYYLGGSTSSNDGDISDTGFGNEDAWLMKTDQWLNPIYDTLFGGNNHDAIFHMIASNTKLFLAINSISDANTGNLTTAKKGTRNGVIVCLDLNDNVLWQQSYGGDGQDEIYDLDEFSNGDLLLTLLSNSNASLDKTEDNIGNGNDVWLVRIDQTGNIIWEKSIDGLEHESFANTTIDNNDNAYVLSTSSSNLGEDKSEDSYGLMDLWLIKLNSNGNILWDKTIGGSGFDSFGNILYKDNALYVTSRSNSNINSFKSEDAINGSQDIWMLKIDLNGNLITENTIGSSTFDNAGLLMFDGNKLVVTGTTSLNANNDQTIGFSQEGVWMLELDTNLNLLNQRAIDGFSSDYPTGTFLLNPHNYLVMSGSSSSAGLDKTDGALGGEDAWIVILSEDLGIEYLNIFSTINLYPNPAENTINLSLENQEEIEYVQMFNLQGKEIIRTIKTQINLSGLNAGIYLIKVKSKNGNSYTERVVKK